MWNPCSSKPFRALWPHLWACGWTSASDQDALFYDWTLRLKYTQVLLGNARNALPFTHGSIFHPCLVMTQMKVDAPVPSIFIYFHLFSSIFIYFHLCSSIYFHLFSSIFIYFHLFSSIFIYFHLFSSIFIYFHLFSSIFIYFHLFSSIFIYFHLLSSIFIYFHLFSSIFIYLSIFIYFHLFSSIFIYFHLFSSIFIYFHLFSSIFIYFHLFSSMFIYFHLFSTCQFYQWPKWDRHQHGMIFKKWVAHGPLEPSCWASLTWDFGHQSLRQCGPDHRGDTWGIDKLDHLLNGNSRILNWRYVSTIFGHILWGYSLKLRPEK